MKLIEFKEYNNAEKNVLNKRKVAVAMALAIITFVFLLLLLIYACSPKFRNWADMHILMKVVYQGNLSSINIDSNEKTSIIAYDKYVAVLNNNQLNIYNSSAKKVENMEFKISDPIYESNGRFVVVAEKGKDKVYLLSGTKLLWSKDVDGTISRININENGYVSLVCSGSTYKSVVVVFDQNGNELFKTYIPDNKVVDSVISSDNKYLSFAEVDTTGTLISSKVKTISIKDAQNSSQSAIVNTYDMPTNNLVLGLKYQGSKNLVCMTDEGVSILSDGKIEQMLSLKEEEKNYSFAGIDLINNVYQIEEISDGISNQSSNLKLVNTGTKRVHKYSIPSIAKDTLSMGDIVAVNMGTEVYFVNTKGMLKKKYIATEEIRDVLISEKVAAIVFRDHIEILTL